MNPRKIGNNLVRAKSRKIMKRKILLFFTILSSQASPTWASDYNENNTHRSLSSAIHSADQSSLHLAQQSKQALSDVDKVIDENPPAQVEGEKVLFIGLTASGKSTTVNLLQDKKLWVDESGKLYTKDPVKGSEIGAGIESETRIPSLSKVPNSNLVLCDLAGFEDTRGGMQDIVNAYAAHKLFKGQCKFLLTVSEASMLDISSKWLDLLNNLTKSISVDQLIGSTALLVTQQGLAPHQTPHQRLQQIIQTPGSHHALTDDVRTLLSHLTEENHIQQRVLFFPLPKHECSEYCSYSDNSSQFVTQESVKDRILESITALSSVENPEITFNLRTDKSQVYITGLYEHLLPEAAGYLRTLMSNITSLCTEQIMSWDSETNLDELRANLKAVVQASDHLDNAELFLQSFDRFFVNEPNTLREYVNILEFLKILDDRFTYPPQWAPTFQSTLSDLKSRIGEKFSELNELSEEKIEEVSKEVIDCCKSVNGSEENKLSQLQNYYDLITKACSILQEGRDDQMQNFVNQFDIFYTNEENPLKKVVDNAISFKGNFTDMNLDLDYSHQKGLAILLKTSGEIKDLISEANRKVAKAEQAKREAAEAQAQALKLAAEQAKRKAVEAQAQAQALKLAAEQDKRKAAEAEQARLTAQLAAMASQPPQAPVPPSIVATPQEGLPGYRPIASDEFYRLKQTKKYSVGSKKSSNGGAKDLLHFVFNKNGHKYHHFYALHGIQ